MIWLEIIGWVGSTLLIVSLLQSGMMRLRILNGVASVILIAYNAALMVWPMAGMNLAVLIIDIWYITQLSRASRRPQQLEIGAGAPDSAPVRSG